MEIDAERTDYIADTIDLLISKLNKKEWKTLSENIKSKLCELQVCVGQTIEKVIYNERLEFSSKNKDIDELKKIDAISWLNDRNKLLLSFLQGVTGVSSISTNEKKVNALAHTVEQVYYPRNLNTITPFAFKRNLITCSLTHSKQAVKMYGNWESSGSYTTLLNTLLQPSSPIKCPTKNDIINTIDNNQKVGKCGRTIKEGSKIPISICTTVGHIIVKPETQFQQMHQLSPECWLGKISPNEIAEKIKLLESDASNLFRQYRGKFISEMINEVRKEQFCNEYQYGIRDYVDISVQNERKSNICSKCSEAYGKTITKCPNCNFDSTKHEINHDPYIRTESKHPKEKPRMHVGEPCMVNPCSQEAVYDVMSHIQKLCSVGSEEERKWTTLISDGVPYILASDIQDFVLNCSQCDVIVDAKGIDKEELHSFLHEHEMECLSDIPISKRFTSNFKNFLLLPGLGHMELNEARLLLKLLWEPLISHVSSLLGFRTPRAKQVVREGIDHHRNRQILSVCLDAISKELLVPFVRDSIKNDRDPTAEFYQEWLSHVEDRSYLFYYHITYSYLLSFHLLTEGVRKNNSNHIMAARIQFAPLFCSFQHPKYQQLYLRDIWQRVQMPEILQNYLIARESFSVSGKENAGQGGDFLHEELNKRIKSLLPPIMPTEDVWRKICRNLEDLEELRDSIVTIPETHKKIPNLANEVTMLRREIRKNLFTNDLTESRPLISLSDTTLDQELVNIKYNSQENYENYKSSFFTTGQYGTKILKPVFVTADDRVEYDKIESKTKAEIMSQINDMLDIMPDRELAAAKFKEIKKLEKKAKKIALIGQFYEIKSLLAEQNVTSLLENSEECDE